MNKSEARCRSLMATVSIGSRFEGWKFGGGDGGGGGTSTMTIIMVPYSQYMAIV